MSSVYEEEMVTACEGHTNVWEITIHVNMYACKHVYMNKAYEYMYTCIYVNM